MATKKELNALKKEIKALERKLDKFLKADETGKYRPTKAKAVKAKSAKKATKAKTVKAKPAKKATKAPAEKKAAKVTDTDMVLNIINSSEKGVDSPTLKKKTGFDDKKVRNIIFRSMKQGKIKRAERGVYVGVKQD
jgi:hypothetical protein